MVLEKTKFSRNPKTAWQQIDDKVVVVTPDTKKIHILYESGASIWDYLEAPKSLGDLINNLQAEYNVEPTQAESDVQHYLSDLVDRNIVSVC